MSEEKNGSIKDLEMRIAGEIDEIKGNLYSNVKYFK